MDHPLRSRAFQLWSVIVIMLLIGLAPAAQAATSIVYVVPGGSGDGSSWAQGQDLQAALQAATGGSELWVQAGTYKPTTGATRTASFVLKSGVAIYGGFAGTETARDQRDVTANLSILSGDLAGNDGAAYANTDENSFHVVYASGADATAILDGLTIRGGNASDTAYTCPVSCGGGLFNTNSSPTLANLTISGSQAYLSGGGLYNDHSNPTLTDVTLSGNRTSFGGGMSNFHSNPILTNVTISGNDIGTSGGGLNNDHSNPTLINVVISGNQAYSYGGGLSNAYSNPIFTNVTIAGNRAGTDGGGLYNVQSSMTMQNSIVWGNVATLRAQFAQQNTSADIVTVRHSIVQGGYMDGTAISAADPLFVAAPAATNAPATAGDLRLQPGSPAINVGDNSVVPADVATDRGGMPRLRGGIVDMGAYEKQFVIASGTPPDGIIERDYSFAFIADGAAPITFNMTGGALPPGLALTEDGMLTGTPTEVGSYTFTITASNGTDSDIKTATLIIETPVLKLYLPLLTQAAPPK